MKSYVYKWEEISIIHKISKRWIWRIYKIFCISIREIQPTNQKNDKRYGQTYYRHETQVAKKHKKRFSSSLVIKEMWLKTVKTNLPRMPLLNLRSGTIPSVEENVDPQDPLHITDGNVNWGNHLWKTGDYHLLKSSIQVPYDQANL